jgi:hypothetical protein
MPVRFETGVIWYSCLEPTCYETDGRFWRWDVERHEFAYYYPERKKR